MKAFVFAALLGTVFSKPVLKFDHSFTNRHGEMKNGTLTINQPTLCDPSVQQLSGYFASGTEGREYFFWFFESRNDPSTDPLVMWLTGGPGCSSILALLTENGPCYVNDNGDGTYLSETSWNSKANAIWVDQPPGTGFSKGYPDTDEEEVAADMYTFLQNFIKAYPKYFDNGFYIFGESYAGHYVPAISYNIFEENSKGGGTNIPLKAFAIGNGLTDPYIQFAYYAQMAYNSTTADHVITDATFNRMTEEIPECQKEISECNQEDTTTNCDDAYGYCIEHEIEPVTETGVNPYNLDEPCTDGGLCYNFTSVGIWLNNETVQSALGVDKEWADCNTVVNEFFEADWMVDYQTKIPPMLDAGIRGLIYAGDLDFICNYMGNQAWALRLNWTYAADFGKAPVNTWSDSTGTACGELRSSNGFNFLQVFNAGHMVPRDQPACALAMMEAWIEDTL